MIIVEEFETASATLSFTLVYSFTDFEVSAIVLLIRL
jgi:hypothetical protein